MTIRQQEYDGFGNLKAISLPNGTVTTYTYDTMNRLDVEQTFKDANANLLFDTGDTSIAKYDYDVDAAGTRKQVVEANSSGTTTVKWTYDAANRLVREVYDTIGTDLDFITDYTYDLAGNRTGKSTDYKNAITTAMIVDEAIIYEYDANDRLSIEKIDDKTATNVDRYISYAYSKTQQTEKATRNGLLATGTLLSKTTYSYDTQGRMSKVQTDTDGNGSIDSTSTYTYDANGIRVTQTVDGVKTTYLIDAMNPTGYAQVMVEKQGATVKKSYTIGHDVVSQKDATNGVLYFGYDGHGSTRVLTTNLGAIKTGQIFHYDAYGNAIGFTPATALTSLLYSGEQFDAKLGMQYLRQRYYDPRTGRFNRLDPFFGNLNDPQSLHKYAYCHANPIDFNDPSGMFEGLAGMLGSISIGNSGHSTNNRVQAASYVRSASTLQKFQRAFDMFDRVMDLMDTVEGVFDIIAGGPGFFLDMLTSAAQSQVNFSNLIKSAIPNKCMKGSVDLPESLVKWLNKKTKNAASSNIISEVIGTIATNFLARAVGLETVSIKLAYHGIDAVYKIPGIGTYVIAESKGGTSMLKMTSKNGMQMHDTWINNSINKITNEGNGNNDMKALYGANLLRIPMLAVIVKLNLHRNDPQIDFGVQFYRGIVDWGKPFE